MERGKVDLRKCERGDKLISALGAELEYVEPFPEGHYMDHKVLYKKIPGKEVKPKCFGSRTHDGYVFRQKRIPETDHDIVQIIPKSK